MNLIITVMLVHLSMSSAAWAQKAVGLKSESATASGPEADSGEQQTDTQDAKQGKLPGQDVIETIAGYLGGSKLKCVKEKIESTLRPAQYSGREVGAANYGLMGHFDEVLKANPCFAARADEFWKSISEKLALEEPEAFKNTGEIKEPKGFDEFTRALRPKLHERAGQGRFAKNSPGWLWQAAMKATNNQPQAAMALLGMCMHDDIGLSPKFKIQGEKARTLALKSLQEERAQILKQLEVFPDDSPALKFLRQKLEKVENKLREAQEAKANQILHEAPIACPNGLTSVFAQQAVDSSFDLSDELKNEIRKQWKDREPPSKAYHFVGAAYLGCEISQCGIGPDEASHISSILAGLYRANRICPKMTRELEILKDLEKEFNAGFGTSEFTKRFSDRALRSKYPSGSKIEAEKWTTNRMNEFAAARLFARWYLGGPESSIANACTYIRLPWVPREERPSEKPGEIRVGPQPTVCGADFTPALCDAAQKKLRNWDVDVAWTSRQHAIGSRFGAEKCSAGKARPSLDQMVCGSSSGSGSQVEAKDAVQ